jgi:hypothetical protein
MNHSQLTISFTKGRNRTVIGKIIELPGIEARGTNNEEVRVKLLAALQQYQQRLTKADEPERFAAANQEKD